MNDPSSALPQPPDPAELARLQRQYPDWMIWHDERLSILMGLKQPTPTAAHVVAARTIAELTAKLEKAERDE